MPGAGPWDSGPFVRSSQPDPHLSQGPVLSVARQGVRGMNVVTVTETSPLMIVMRCDSGLVSFWVWYHGGIDE